MKYIAYSSLVTYVPISFGHKAIVTGAVSPGRICGVIPQNIDEAKITRDRSLAAAEPRALLTLFSHLLGALAGADAAGEVAHVLPTCQKCYRIAAYPREDVLRR